MTRTLYVIVVSNMSIMVKVEKTPGGM